MSIEQQIQACEEQIKRLEQMKNYRNTDEHISEVQMSRINKDLDQSYQQMAVLKIRRMMGY